MRLAHVVCTNRRNQGGSLGLFQSPGQECGGRRLQDITHLWLLSSLWDYGVPSSAAGVMVSDSGNCSGKYFVFPERKTK